MQVLGITRPGERNEGDPAPGLNRLGRRVDFHSQYDKLARFRPENGKQGEAKDEAKQGTQVAGTEDEQPIPPAD